MNIRKQLSRIAKRVPGLKSFYLLCSNKLRRSHYRISFLFESFYLTHIKKYSRLKCPFSYANKAFDVYIVKCDKGYRVFKKLHGISPCSENLRKTLRNKQHFSEYVEIIEAITADTILKSHVSAVYKIDRDGSYWAAYIEGHNMMAIRDSLRDGQSLLEGAQTVELKVAIDELLQHLREYKLCHSEIIGDWALHNLIYSPQLKKILNVDVESFYTCQKGRLESNLEYIETILNFIKQLIELCLNRDSQDKQILTILSAVGKAANLPVCGRHYPAGYHSLNLGGKFFRGQRLCKQRLDSINYDFTGKVVLDLGCNCGGMLHCLADKIHMGIGVDNDANCIHVANLIKQFNSSSNLHFSVTDLSKESLSCVNGYLEGSPVDICFFLSLCIWIPNWRQLLEETSRIANTILFESTGLPEQQEEQVAVLREIFTEIRLIQEKSTDDLFHHARSLYLCSQRKEKKSSP